MSEWITLMQEVQELLGNPELPLWQRLARSVPLLARADPPESPSSARERVDQELARIHDLLRQYSLESEEDYRRIVPEHLQTMLRSAEAAAAQAIQAELDRIVVELDCDYNQLPVAAIKEARKHRELMIPRLIQVLEETAAQVRRGKLPQGSAHFFALYLLSEFNAQEALPAILEVISLPSDPLDFLFGDAITGDFHRILAQFALDRPQVLDSLLSNPEVDRYVRWAAAQAYLFLIREGVLTREEVVRLLGKHLREAMAQDDSDMTSILICELAEYAPEEIWEDIQEAFDRDLVETLLIDLDHLQKRLRLGKEAYKQGYEWKEPLGIQDTIKELEDWESFREKEEERETAPSQLVSLPPIEPLLEMVEPQKPLVASSVQSYRGVRRNDPCPCGSGKKFKRCCGARR